MLRSCAMTSMRVLHGLQTPTRSSAILLGNPWLQGAPLKRDSTTGAVREAARNAKATLLRAAAVPDTQAARETSASAPGFLDLAVDDRVLVRVENAQCDSMRFHKTLSLVTEQVRPQGRLSESSVQAPTAVQQAAIPAVLSGKNVALQCYTGSGKVGACFTRHTDVIVMLRLLQVHRQRCNHGACFQQAVKWRALFTNNMVCRHLPTCYQS